MKSLSLVMLVFILGGCSSEPEMSIPEEIASLENVSVYSGDEPPRYSISLEREARFGDVGDIYIGSIAGVVVTDNGTLLLADQAEAVLRVFDPSGNYITAIGGKGEGPGEFRSLSDPRLSNGEIFVLDGQQQRISVFDAADFSFLRSHPVGSAGNAWGGFPVMAHPLPQNQFLIVQNSIQRDGDTFYMYYVPSIFDSEGDSVRTEIVTFPRNLMHTIQSDNAIRLTSLSFLGETHIGFTANNELVSGFSDRFLFHVMSLEGDTLRSIYHSVTPPRLDRTEMLAEYDDDAIRKDIASMDIPESRPVYESFFVDDDNRFWVELLTDNRDVNKWWVLDENGEKLAEFEQPASTEIETVKDGYVYFLETEEETGFREVVKYRFVFGEG